MSGPVGMKFVAALLIAGGLINIISSFFTLIMGSIWMAIFGSAIEAYVPLSVVPFSVLSIIPNTSTGQGMIMLGMIGLFAGFFGIIAGTALWIDEPIGAAMAIIVSIANIAVGFYSLPFSIISIAMSAIILVYVGLMWAMGELA